MSDSVTATRCGERRTGGVQVRRAMSAATWFGAALVACAPGLPQGPGEARLSSLISPEGERLVYGIPAYNADGEMTTRLIVCNLDGTEPREVTTLLGRCRDTMWLTNERLICRSPYPRRYHVIGLSGERLADVVLPPLCPASGGIVSPDGNHVTFVGAYGPHAYNYAFGLYVVDLATGEVRWLIRSPLKSAPAWSPDSTKIAVGNAAGHARTHPLTIIDVRTGEATPTGIDGAGPAWSPDGRFIACTTDVTAEGTWSGGVPVEGRIGVLEIATRELTYVTPRARDTRDPVSGECELGGCLQPTWSPDGRWLAYRRSVARQTDPRSDLRRTETIWVVGRDGKRPRKMLDGPAKVLWGPAARHLYVERLDAGARRHEITRISLTTLEPETVASWPQPTPPKLPQVEPTVIRRAGVEVQLTHLDPAYGHALATILSEARHEYEDVWGLPCPESIVMKVTRDPRAAFQFHASDHIVLTVPTETMLMPDAQSGVRPFEGTCHELAHLVMLPHVRSPRGLPRGVSEGWAYYASGVVAQAVLERVGAATWPQPFEAELDGRARLDTYLKGSDVAEPGPELIGTIMFEKLGEHYGHPTVGRAMARALERRPEGHQLMPRFINALHELTGDHAVEAIVPREMVDPWPPQWRASRAYWQKEDAYFFADMKLSTYGDGVALRYDDGTADGSEEISYFGPTVLFERPQGRWALDAVSVFASRTGGEEAPRGRLGLYLCDDDLVPIARSSHEVSAIGTQGLKWHTLPIDPVEIPQRFQIHLSARGLGLSVAYDGGAVGHGRLGDPEFGAYDTKAGCGWMIRALLKPVEQDAPRGVGVPVPPELELVQPGDESWRHPGNRAGETVVGPDGGELVWVPPGTFSMGSDDGAPNERPVHEVRITRGFWMGKCEVTNAQFRRFRPRHDSGSYKGASLNGGTQPVVMVSWEGARAYCRHWGLSLPTEAEWEYACRGGSESRYWWGDEERRAGTCANLADRTLKAGFEFPLRIFDVDDGYAATAPVGSFAPNPFGLHDMLGNVWEWCHDWYYFHKPGLQTDPTGPGVGTGKAWRGAAYDSQPSLTSTASRGAKEPDAEQASGGFRVVARP